MVIGPKSVRLIVGFISFLLDNASFGKERSVYECLTAGVISSTDEEHVHYQDITLL